MKPGRDPAVGLGVGGEGLELASIEQIQANRLLVVDVPVSAIQPHQVGAKSQLEDRRLRRFVARQLAQDPFNGGDPCPARVGYGHPGCDLVSTCHGARARLLDRPLMLRHFLPRTHRRITAPAAAPQAPTAPLAWSA